MSRKKTKGNRSVFAAVLLSVTMIFGGMGTAFGAQKETEITKTVAASGRYSNWDGVTNVAQFTDGEGNLCFAVDDNSVVTVYRTNSDREVVQTIPLTKQHPLFGTAICDANGNFYLVTGETNATEDTSVETVFISKYDSNGNLVATTGDNGSSSLPFYYDPDFYTKEPFEGGNCDAAIHGNVLTVSYARHMYNGHQSISVFSVNIDDMSKVNVGDFYQSHSFAQRVVSTKDGFVYMSEGDCYDRAFTSFYVKLSDAGAHVSDREAKVFDFWVEDGALEKGNMFVVNDNFAHMGGLAALSDGRVAFVSQSAQSLNTNAASEKEEIFIQIFDPNGDLSTADAYTTMGVRSGLAGNNGRDEVTNYGVKWLTSYGTGATVSNVQTVAVADDKIIVLYELTEGYTYKGVYCMVLDANGEVISPATLYSATARLNPCEMPVVSNGEVCWVCNKYGDLSGKIGIYSLDPANPGSGSGEIGSGEIGSGEIGSGGNGSGENGTGGETPVQPSIALSQTTANMVKGDVIKLAVTVTPESEANGLVWSTTNSRVAMIDASGNVSALGVGEATITVTNAAGTMSAECKVTVTASSSGTGGGGGTSVGGGTSLGGGSTTSGGGSSSSGGGSSTSGGGSSTSGGSSSSGSSTTVGGNTDTQTGNTTVKAPDVKIKKIKSRKKGKVFVKWGKKSQVDGYEIMYSKNSDFSGSKTETKYSGNTLTLSGFKKGNMCYVKVRTFVYDAAKNKVYGSWSSVRNVKISKK